MAKWQRMLLDVAIVLGAFVAGCVVRFVGFWLYLTKIYLPRLPSGVGAVAGGVSPSLLGGLFAGSIAVGILFLRKRRAR